MWLKAYGLLEPLAILIGVGGVVLAFQFKGWLKIASVASLALTVSWELYSFASVQQDAIVASSDAQVKQLPVSKGEVTEIMIPKDQAPSSTGEWSVVVLYKASSGQTEQTGSLSARTFAFDLPSGAKPYLSYQFLPNDIEGYHAGFYNTKVHVPENFKKMFQNGINSQYITIWTAS